MPLFTPLADEAGGLRQALQGDEGGDVFRMGRAEEHGAQTNGKAGLLSRPQRHARFGICWLPQEHLSSTASQMPSFI